MAALLSVTDERPRHGIGGFDFGTGPIGFHGIFGFVFGAGLSAFHGICGFAFGTSLRL